MKMISRPSLSPSILFTASWISSMLLALAILIYSAPANGQTVTGQISGTVTDPTGAVIAGAQVVLTATETGAVRKAQSDTSGVFIFADVIPGTYRVQISAPGFETYSQDGVVVSASEKVALHNLSLTIGSSTAEVTVQANTAHVETESSEHSAEITAQQFVDVPDRGRNFVDYLALLPGTVTVSQTDAPNSGSIGFNGAENQTLIQLDGVASQDIGAVGATGFLAPNIDAISEVKVLSGAVPAEYGVRANGTVTVVVKSGTRDFHGSVYEFNRNDDYNANTYFNKLNHVARSPYKFNNPGFTVGGPVIIPGVDFNKNRDRLFFFVSGDFLFRNVPATGVGNFVVPTMAERAGNFSYVTGTSYIQGSTSAIQCPNGGTPTSYNPLTCPGFPTSPAGTALMGLFPNPTCNRTAGNGPTQAGVATDPMANAGLTLPNCPSTSNLIVAPFISSQPRHDYILRTDFNVTKNNLFYVRLIRDHTGNDGGTFLGGASWGQLRTNYDIRSEGAVADLISTIRPNIVNEFVVGEDIGWQNITPNSEAQFAKNVRSNVGLGPSVLPTLFPISQNNPQDLLPNASFGGGNFVGSAAALSEDPRYHFYSDTRSINLTEGLTWSIGRHTMKFGVYYENDPKASTGGSTSGSGTSYNGQFNFQVSAFSSGAFANPLDTGYSYSNAYLGTFQNYTETSQRPFLVYALGTTQWYAQDTWKATRRLTLDYGIRFYHIPDPIERDNKVAAYFSPSAYNASAQPQLIQPNDPNFPKSAVGLFVPGSGTPYQGMITTVHHLRNNAPLGYAPRVGFAWDVFGNGRTALRGGFGVFYDQLDTEMSIKDYLIEPPVVVVPTVFNSNITSLSGAAGYLGPTNVFATTPNYQLPVSYEYNLDVQHDLGRGVLLDVGYVGNVARHGLRPENSGDQINPVSYGADFVPANKPLASHPNFLRPYLGYGSINMTNFSVNSSYNSLQVQVTKRVGRLSAAGSYTWSKVLDDSFGSGRVYFIPLHRYYGPGSSDRRHNLTVNWTYALTNANQWRNLFAKSVAGGWNIQGIASFVSGSPSTITPSFTYDVNGASAAGNQGGPVAVNLIGYPVLSNGSRTKRSSTEAPQYLNLADVQAPAGGPGTCTLTSGPASCGLGNASLAADFYGPGINNWNISLFKNFPLGSESRKFQLRIESYNTFNHTQFTGVNSRVTITPSGVASLAAQNSTFGLYTGTQSARILVLAGKLFF